MTDTSPGETLSSSLERLRRDRELLDRLAESDGLGVEFQPVVDLATGATVGYKASARGPQGTGLERPSGLLSSARASGHLDRLDWLFRIRALEAALDAGLTPATPLFVTFEPETYGSPCPPRHAATFGRAKRGLRIVVDVAIRAFETPDELRRGVADFRAAGFGIAVDDIADRPQARVLLDEVAPDYVKVDLALPGRAPTDRLEAGVRELVDYAGARGAVVLAESVDTEARRSDAVTLGATLGRGLSLGRPGPLPTS